MAHPESAKIRIMTNSKTEISLTKKVFAKIVSAVSAMALAVSLAGAVSAEEYTESYDDYADNGTAAVQSADDAAAAQSADVNIAGAVAEKPKLDQVKLIRETKYSDATHPYNRQTSAITVNWNAVDNAQKYEVYMKTKQKDGTYGTKWKLMGTTAGETSFTVTGLKRNWSYAFKVRAKASGYKTGKCSKVQKINTARIDYDRAGWKAMCRIVYHEVGGINDSMWDAPIVYVSDCVVNQYEAAKYLNDSLWAPYYRRYSSIQDVIYRSGGFMSDAGLAYDGATYGRVTDKVKKAVYGAVYDKVTVSGIDHDDGVYYWCNTSYRPNSYKVAYSYKIPWGYFNIWTEYWG